MTEGKLEALAKANARIAIDRGIGCWLTPSTKYMSVWSGKDKKMYAAHRLSYEYHKGEIAEGLFVCHKCDVMNCINPEHLFLGTSSDNAIDAVEKKRQYNSSKTECKRGHKYTKENTYYRPNGRRYCRECHKISERNRRESLLFLSK